MFFKKFLRKRTPEPKDLAMRQVLSVSKRRAFPSLKQWRQLPQVLSVVEKRVLFSAGSLLFASFLSVGIWYVATHQAEVPAVGGEYTEALIGEPRFVNPLYASSSDVDSDLTKLVFSGLLKWDPSQGLVNDLAENVAVSEDGKTYTVRIRDGARFHNNDEIRARDVIFTIDAIQNRQYASTLAVSFQGVSVSQVDDKTISFVLAEPFAPFLSTLTVGILPAEVWQDIPPRNAALASFNLEPVGSGPYRFAEFSKDKKGAVRSYTLERNDDYYGEKPRIETITFKFYPDADSAVKALENRNVEGVSFVPPELESEVEKNRSVAVLRPTIPRQTALYFNQERQPLFKDAALRKAVAQAVNKQAILEEVLHGYGTVIDAPILPGMLGEHPDVAKRAFDPAAANLLLDEAGFPRVEGEPYRLKSKEAAKKRTEAAAASEVSTDDTLSFILTTVQSPEFIRMAELLTEQLAVIGIKLTVEVVEPDALFSSVIQPRNYELLLTGLLLGIDSDPYPFWHSSQAKQGGLNLSGYANRKVDTLLEEARVTIDQAVRAEKYRAFQDTVAEDTPAVFLYQSTYTYAIPTKIKDVLIERIATPADRFANISSWYIKTKKTLRR